MIKRFLALLVTGTGILALSGCVSSSTGTKRPPTVEELFKRADKNGDGKVSRVEFTDAMIADVFARYDRNGDGFITIEEYVADGGTPEGFRKINRSGTGKITLEEAKTSKLIVDRMAIPFDEADVDRSGYVTLVEFQRAKERARSYNR